MSYGGVEGEGDVLVVAAGGEGDLRQSEVVLGAGQRGVQHQHVALRHKERGDVRLQHGELGNKISIHGRCVISLDTSPSRSRGGKWKKRDCPRETLLMGLSRLSLLYSFT